jgi:hypothetical protein
MADNTPPAPPTAAETADPADGLIAVSAEPLSSADQELLSYFANLRRASLETLENAARQLITLVTTLLGLFFGVLAFKDDPAYRQWLPFQVTGGISIFAYTLCLFFALRVVLPRPLDVPEHDLTRLRALLRDLFEHKSGNLRRAQRLFGFATLCLLALTLFLLFKP